MEHRPNFLTPQDICEITKMSEYILNNYLDSYKFNKFKLTERPVKFRKFYGGNMINNSKVKLMTKLAVYEKNHKEDIEISLLDSVIYAYWLCSEHKEKKQQKVSY